MVKSAWCKIFIYKWAVRNACGGVKKDVHYFLKRSDVNVYYKNVIQSCCNVNITDEAFQCNVRKEKKKKNECLFILFARHSRSPRIGRNKHYTIDINQVLRRASIACVCMFSHTHSHTQFLVYPSAATDNYTFNSFGENQRKLGSPFFYFIFSTQTQHEKCFIKVQNTFESFTISYITWVRKQLPPPPSSRRQKKKKRRSQPSGLTQSLWAASSKLMTQSLQITRLYYYKITGNKMDKTLR